MRPIVRRDAFARAAELAYRQQDPYDVCPICGKDIYWPVQSVWFDENDRMCHTQCLEEGLDHESEDFQ